MSHELTSLRPLYTSIVAAITTEVAARRLVHFGSRASNLPQLKRNERCMLCRDPDDTDTSPHPDPLLYPHSQQLGLLCTTCRTATKLMDRQLRADYILRGWIRPRS